MIRYRVSMKQAGKDVYWTGISWSSSPLDAALFAGKTFASWSVASVMSDNNRLSLQEKWNLAQEYGVILEPVSFL